MISTVNRFIHRQKHHFARLLAEPPLAAIWQSLVFVPQILKLKAPRVVHTFFKHLTVIHNSIRILHTTIRPAQVILIATVSGAMIFIIWLTRANHVWAAVLYGPLLLNQMPQIPGILWQSGLTGGVVFGSVATGWWVGAIGARRRSQVITRQMIHMTAQAQHEAARARIKRILKTQLQGAPVEITNPHVMLGRHHTDNLIAGLTPKHPAPTFELPVRGGHRLPITSLMQNQALAGPMLLRDTTTPQGRARWRTFRKRGLVVVLAVRPPKNQSLPDSDNQPVPEWILVSEKPDGTPFTTQNLRHVTEAGTVLTTAALAHDRYITAMQNMLDA